MYLSYIEPDGNVTCVSRCLKAIAQIEVCIPLSKPVYYFPGTTLRNYYGKTPGSSTANLILAFHLAKMKVTATFFPPTLTILVGHFLVCPGDTCRIFVYTDVIWPARLILFLAEDHSGKQTLTP